MSMDYVLYCTIKYEKHDIFHNMANLCSCVVAMRIDTRYLQIKLKQSVFPKAQQTSSQLYVFYTS